MADVAVEKPCPFMDRITYLKGTCDHPTWDASDGGFVFVLVKNDQCEHYPECMKEGKGPRS